MSYNGTSYTPSQFVGTTPSYASARDEQIDTGAFFSAQDDTDQQRYLVVGPTVVTNLFNGQNPVGQTVKVNGVSFQVVGVLKSKGTNGIQDQDDIAIAPLMTTRSLLTGTTGGLSQIVIQATLEQGGRRRRGRDRLDPRARAHEQRQRHLPRAQPGLAARDHERDQPRLHACCSPRSRRSPCWWAGSA